MTIYKSQGGEIYQVLTALPELSNPVLTKETITGPMKSIKLVVSEAVFTTTIRQKIERITGLIDKFK
jgi:exodeoxyribonuclease V alpha subunit